MLPKVPLAEKLRPKHWQDVIGQEHLLGKGKPLRIVFESGVPHSMIFWGPPGVGKTTIARLCAQAFNCEWIAISAVFSGIKEIREAVSEAKSNLEKNMQTILFIDEIHRFNKAQQDALLPFTESGLLTIIGATTENPSFEVNRALLSRMQVYVLNSLTEKNLKTLFNRVQKEIFPQLLFQEKAIEHLIFYSDGDARRLLNFLEQINLTVASKAITEVDLNLVQEALSNLNRRFDKQGEYFYDHISALHKSVRGSHPDAALYWFCRMLDGGVDPLYLARRIIRMAWEDIGLADPRAMQLANDAALTYERLGSPEGELALGQAVIYMAVASKSNAGYKAFNQAKAFVKQDKSREIPLHLRNAPTKLLKNLGYGRAYRYAHDELYAYAAGETYLPEGMKEPHWYQPVSRGLEAQIAERMAFFRKLDEDSKK